MAQKRKQATRILIVDDHPVVREGLALRIARQPDLEVCGEAGTVPEALRLAGTLRPAVAVVDIALQTGDGLDLVRRLRARHPEVKALVWSMYSENLYAERALRAGALGFVTKDQTTEQIIKAIRRVRDGKVYLSEPMSQQLMSAAVGVNRAPAANAVDTLSDRELEVLRLLGQALKTQQVAEKMHLSPKTVETYQARIKDKLKLGNSRQLYVYAAHWAVESGEKAKRSVK